MKNKVIQITKLTAIASFVLAVFSIYGCAKAGIGGPSYTIDGDADGSQVVPVSTSAATGSISGTFIGSKNVMTGTISWDGLSGAPTAIHIHGADAGRNGYPFFVLTNIPKTKKGSMTFTSAFTESEEKGIPQNHYYFDIHTAAHPEGEIRGQIFAH